MQNVLSNSKDNIDLDLFFPLCINKLIQAWWHIALFLAEAPLLTPVYIVSSEQARIPRDPLKNIIYNNKNKIGINFNG